MISFQKKNTTNETKSWREGSEHIKVIWEHHTNFSVFHFPVGKNMHKDFLADNSQECMKNWLSCHISWEKINAIEKKECVHYLLGLSISSIAARSFCLAFLLIWDPRQTFTRLVSCFVEYSCSRKKKKRSKFSTLKDMYLINARKEQADTQFSVDSDQALQISEKQRKL